MTLRLHYFGTSMSPLLRLGDVLVVEPCAGREPQVGDVVVFAHPLNPAARVVHRVVAVDRDGLRTRGDNCPAMDPWVVNPEGLTGYVAAACRRGRTFPLDRGLAQQSALLHTLQGLDRVISDLLRPLYRRLAAVSPLRGWLRPRTLTFMRPGGREWQLWLGPWLVGRRLPHWDGWHIRRPFGLFIDENDLP